MKSVFDQVQKVFDREKANGKVWVNYFENVSDLLNDGMDKEFLDNNYFIWGSDSRPSELNEPFVIVEAEGADLPVFTKNSGDQVITYLKNSYSEFIKN